MWSRLSGILWMGACNLFSYKSESPCDSSTFGTGLDNTRQTCIHTFLRPLSRQSGSHDHNTRVCIRPSHSSWHYIHDPLFQELQPYDSKKSPLQIMLLSFKKQINNWHVQVSCTHIIRQRCARGGIVKIPPCEKIFGKYPPVRRDRTPPPIRQIFRVFRDFPEISSFLGKFRGIFGEFLGNFRLY